MGLDKDELKKLSPEERIQRLKEMEDKAKKELEDAEVLMVESKKLMESSQQEILRNEIKKEAEALREQQGIQDIFAQPEGDNLEETALREAPQPESAVSLEDLYNTLQGMQNSNEDTGYLNNEIIEDVRTVVEALGNDYKTASEQYDLLQASKNLIDELKDSYHGGPNMDYQP